MIERYTLARRTLAYGRSEYVCDNKKHDKFDISKRQDRYRTTRGDFGLKRRLTERESE